MNEAHWHLVVNHLPIIFPLVGLIVMVTGWISKSDAIKRTAFMIFILGAVATFAAMATGEGAEEVIEQGGKAAKSYIEEHEEIAETFALLSYIVGGISLAGLWASSKNKNFARSIAIVVMLFSVVVLYFASQAGTTGGEISHPEIREDGVNLGKNSYE